MSQGALTQEEIDKMMSEAAGASESQPKEVLTQMETDIIGEVGNISMSQAATTLSELLGHKVLVTTPHVSTRVMRDILQKSLRPKVVTSIEFKQGIIGNNMLMLDIVDSVKIANLMMGGPGEALTETLTELELSAVGEAMNQMIGSASTAMATMLSRMVDIHPPSVAVWDEEKNIDMENFELDSTVCEISFELEVEGILKSSIMQILTLDAVHDISAIMLGDKATVLDRPAKKKEQAPTQKVEQPFTQHEKVAVSKPEFQQLAEKSIQATPKNLDLIMDVPLEFSVLLGESKKTIREILSLGTGSVVELDKMTEAPLNIYVNGKIIAEGEVVVINENFGIRITNILSKEQRLNNI